MTFWNKILVLLPVFMDIRFLYFNHILEVFGSFLDIKVFFIIKGLSKFEIFKFNIYYAFMALRAHLLFKL